MSTLKFVQTPAIALYTGLSPTATSMVVTPYPIDIQTGKKLVYADFGDNPSCTIDPKISSFEEIVIFTGITDNGDGTATLTGLTRNLIGQAPYTTAGIGKQHGSSAVIVFSDNPQMYARLAAKENDNIFSGNNTFTGNNSFTNFPVTPATPNASSSVIGMNKLSVDPVLSTNPIAVGTNDARIPVAYAADASGSDAYVVTPTPAITAYVVGQRYVFKAGTANTGASTVNYSGVGALTLKKNVSADTATGDILVGQIVEFVYDGTNAQIISLTSSLGISANIQTFVANGTYTKPAGAKSIQVICVGAGGGGSGGSANNGSNTNGSSGGGCGAVTFFYADASIIGATETVTVGAGGSGGAGVAAVNTSGASGGNGTASSFGNWIQAGGGGGGPSGGSSAGAGGGSFSSASGNTAGLPSTTGNAISGQGTSTLSASSEYGGAASGNTTASGGSSIFGCGAGGGGGQGNSGNGGAGGTVGAYTAGGGGAGGISSSSAPTAGTAGKANSVLKKGYGGEGGGGGGGSAGAGGVSVGGAGGAGGGPGGGGGGGGSFTQGDNTHLTGAGGPGAGGQVTIITYF